MRKLVQVVSAQSAKDGDGVKIRRLGGRQLHAALNPFLMIDEINSDDAADYIGGFPEHPHRGFETITYMKAGCMRHRDHMGNEGVIGPGDVQWMTAGAGVLHSEMPEQEAGLLQGFQLWLNLPAAEKMQPAAYHEIARTDIDERLLADGGSVRAIAGKVKTGQQTLQGPLAARSTQPVLLDVELVAGGTVELEFNTENPALVYLYKGTICNDATDTTATQSLTSGQLGVFNAGHTLRISAGSEGAEFLVLSGQPIREPLTQYGPFVMNTSLEIEQAVRDFKDPRFLNALTSRVAAS